MFFFLRKTRKKHHKNAKVASNKFAIKTLIKVLKKIINLKREKENALYTIFVLIYRIS